MNNLELAIANPDQRHGDTHFEGIMRALSNDSANYIEATGDTDTFGLWGCLFKFDAEERDALNKACGFKNDPWPKGRNGYITFTIDERGFCAFQDGRMAYDKLASKYNAETS